MSQNVSPKPRTNRLREKDCWHSYGLQMLSPEKFLQVAGRIIEGRYILLTVRRSGGSLEEEVSLKVRNGVLSRPSPLGRDGLHNPASGPQAS